LIAASHRDDDVCPLGKIAGEELWGAVGEIDAKLAHDFDDFGVQVLGGCGPG
jgi:hypothetical protein